MIKTRSTPNDTIITIIPNRKMESRRRDVETVEEISEKYIFAFTAPAPDGHWKATTMRVASVGAAFLVLMLVLMVAAAATTNTQPSTHSSVTFLNDEGASRRITHIRRWEGRTLQLDLSDKKEPIRNDRDKLGSITRTESSRTTDASAVVSSSPVPPVTPAPSAAPSLLPAQVDTTVRVDFSGSEVSFVPDPTVSAFVDPNTGKTVYTNTGGYGYASTKASMIMSSGNSGSVTSVRFRPLDNMVYKSVELKTMVDDVQVAVVVMFTNGRLQLGQNHYVGDYDSIGTPELELRVEANVGLISLYNVYSDGTVTTIASVPYDVTAVTESGPLYATLGFHSDYKVSSLEAVAFVGP